MPEKKNPVIHEISEKRLLLLLHGAFAFIAAGGAYLVFFSPRVQAATYIDALRIAYFICLVMLLLAILRIMRCRLHIDETGVSNDRLPFGQTSLRWEEIATGAIVHLNMSQGSSEPIIVLATRPPEEVLTRQALLGLHGLSVHEHVRFSCTKARTACVQHYLHMTLPEYHL